MFDTILIITLFLLASFLVCLLTLRLSINVKHLCLFFSFITDINVFFKIPTTPFIKNNKKSGLIWVRFLELQVVCLFFINEFLRKNTNDEHLKIKFT